MPPLQRTGVPILAVILLLGSSTVRAATEPNPALRVKASTASEIEFEARGVTIEQALNAIASEAGFEVVITPGIVRPPVNMTVSTAPVEYVLRQILRGRNYSLVYGGKHAHLRQVIVLPPQAATRPGVASRQSFPRNTWVAGRSR